MACATFYQTTKTTFEKFNSGNSRSYASKQHATFPTWLSQLTQLPSFSYHANIIDIIPSNIFSTLPLRALNLIGNRIYGAFPSDGLSNIQLDTLDLSGNELTGGIPSSVRDTKTCNLSGNSILCSGIGNSWNLCQHCQLVPSFGDIMRRIQYNQLNYHDGSSGITSNGIQNEFYSDSRDKWYLSFGQYLSVSKLLSSFQYFGHSKDMACFLFCTLDLNNFGLYEIRMLNLSAYRLPIDHRVPIVFSWIKVFVADISHTAVAIYLMMLHAPVASVLLTCITSGLGVVRAIVQVAILFCSTRQQRKFHLMARASPDDNGDDDTVSQTSIHPISRGIGQSERDKNINNMSAAAESSTTTTTNTKNQVELTHLIK